MQYGFDKLFPDTHIHTHIYLPAPDTHIHTHIYLPAGFEAGSWSSIFSIM